MSFPYTLDLICQWIRDLPILPPNEPCVLHLYCSYVIQATIIAYLTTATVHSLLSASVLFPSRVTFLKYKWEHVIPLLQPIQLVFHCTRNNVQALHCGLWVIWGSALPLSLSLLPLATLPYSLGSSHIQVFSVLKKNPNYFSSQGLCPLPFTPSKLTPTSHT